MDLIAKSLLAVFLLMVLVHVAVNFLRRDLPAKKRGRIAKKIGGGILVVGFFLGTMLGLYLLVPPPNVARTLPAAGRKDAKQDGRIEIVFDRPVSRGELSKTIRPEAPGIWVFEGALYKTHLTRKLVFYPQETLDPDTEYTVTLAGIRNTLKWSQPKTYEFSFKTHKESQVTKVEAGKNEKVALKRGEVRIFFSEPVEGSHVVFEFFPSVNFETKIDKTGKIVSLIFTDELEPAAHYFLKVNLTSMKKDLTTDEMLEEGVLELVYSAQLQTEGVVGEASVLPIGASVAIDDSVAIRFNQAMDRQSVESNFTIEPRVSGSFEWADDYLMTFNPARLAYDTKYTIRVKRGARKKAGGSLKEEVVGSFSTMGKVALVSSSPIDGEGGINVASPVKLTLNQDVSRHVAESKFDIDPPVRGKFGWSSRQMIFTPSEPLKKNTAYRVSLAPGVESIKGLSSDKEIVLGFNTVQSIFRLPVPVFLQKYSLSCEVASLRMALAYKGVGATEDELIEKIGFDPTPHSNGVWGDPHERFVGNINGKQMTTGYGVYWGPIARVARSYREAREFSGWSLSQLLSEVSKGNPAIIWGYASGGKKVYWNTPDGKQILGVSGEHTYVVVGFVGTVENPSRIIVNDSLIGQVRLTRESFEKKWAAFGNSGVVVF
ncbi:hypothetical protein A2215_03650 [Candidatus Berkelbacteria bacterium RIFOXYA2_FULL_43_10]|uniref:Peptidase C39-like domain-containing protein n=1 Tax=Candidatus Berkelbacteria bacterium RIFOXYA2_FULL_43_10 TaxID=1797472 RepID=A0A1F5E546_9BACT|nr:MAG: hypothetical protein A2215_03650 [Candidatus Berkelbacteria bacterium RIFOXYA2_FULL_43_10]